MAVETIDINNENFPFELRCSPIKGVINIYPIKQSGKIKITPYSVPVTTIEAYGFNCPECANNTNYLGKNNITYDYWKNYIKSRYEYIKQNYKVEEHEGKSIS